MKKITIFEANDGTQFSNEADCLRHDKKLEIAILWEQLNEIDTFNPARISDLTKENCQVLTKIGFLAEDVVRGSN